MQLQEVLELKSQEVLALNFVMTRDLMCMMIRDLLRFESASGHFNA